MNDRVLFDLCGSFRKSLIAKHQFYVVQAQTRLFFQFENIEAEADRAAEDWLRQSSKNFDPDRHDPGEFYEAANNAGIEFYSLLSRMRDQTCVSVVAGMFHEWDKDLRDWLVREIQHWHHGSTVASKIWSANFIQIVELLEGIGWPIRTTNYFPKLDACRLVVNVFKHGRGDSLEDLKQRFPEYLDDPFKGSGADFSNAGYRDYMNLKVSDEQYEAFSSAIVSFWEAVPERIFDSQVDEMPSWFVKAFEKDLDTPANTSRQ